MMKKKKTKAAATEAKGEDYPGFVPYEIEYQKWRNGGDDSSSNYGMRPFLINFNTECMVA